MWLAGESRVWAVTDVDLRVIPAPWSFAERHRDEITAHWAQARVERPCFFNGVVHMLADYEVSGAGTFRGRYLRTDFKSFLYWRDTGWRDTQVMDAFGTALIRTPAGKVLLAQQRDGNLNTGFSVVPGGFIDERDIAPDGSIDIVQSVVREISEETGLGPVQLRRGDGFLITQSGPALSIAVPWEATVAEQDLIGVANRHIAADPAGELAHAFFATPEAALDGGLALQDFVRALLGHLACRKTSE